MENRVTNGSSNNYVVKCIFEYFSSSVGVTYITDKQMFVTCAGGDKLHQELTEGIDKMIYPNDKEHPEWRERTVYVRMCKDLRDKKFLLFLPKGSSPNSAELSLSQYFFICSLLDEVKKYDSEGLGKVEILVSTEDDSKYSDADIETRVAYIKEKLKKIIARQVTVREEKILSASQVLNENGIMEVMRFNINLDNCINLNDLINSMSMCEMYSSDDYYGKYFAKLFPNYLEVKELLDKLISERPELMELPLQGLTFENIYDIVSNGYGTGSVGVVR